MHEDSADYASPGPLFAPPDSEPLPEFVPPSKPETYSRKLARAKELFNYTCQVCNQTLGNCPACENRKSELRRLAEELNINLGTIR